MKWRSLIALGIASASLVVWGCSAKAPSSDDDGTGCSTSCGPGQVCSGSACVCSNGLTACGSSCIEVVSDPGNCGGCGRVCDAALVCSVGSCTNSCAQTLMRCGQACVDFSTSTQHCGMCGNACGAGMSCMNGACTCPVAGQRACNGQCTDVAANALNCGACGVQCGAGQACQGGVCTGGSGVGGGAGAGGTGAGGMSGTGAGGTGGSGGQGTGVPNGTPGVVASTDAAGTLGCVPLCQQPTHADDTDLTDDWAWEGWACVLPDSATGTRNQSCLTGDPLPPIDRSGIQGVVVDADGDLVRDCVPLCQPGALPGSPAAPDWGWEYQATCIIRETPTAMCNQGCTTGAPVPDGTLVQRDGVEREEGCVAVCTCGVAGTDPSWGWEFQTTCVMPNTTASMGLPACTTNDNAALLPPAVAGATHDGFYTQNGRLYDAKGAEFVMRGVNNPHIWFDTGNQYRAYQALDKIASYKTNTIRVVWETTGGTASLLRRVLYRIVELKMVPMVELHDVTGGTSNGDLTSMAAYYTQADVMQVLQDFKAYVLINIANEWSGSDYQNAYRAAVGALRTAGLNQTLVIDAGGFGQNAATIFDNASALTTADTQHNLLFSLHMYNQYGSNGAVDAVLDNAAIGSTVPFIVGEFGPQLQGGQVAWQEIVAKCQQHRIGYIAWSWSGNDAGTAALNIVNDFGGALTPSWGQQIMVSNANGIQSTAAKASIFP